MADDKQQKLNYLKECVPSLTMSVIDTVLTEANGDPDRALDELLNFQISDSPQQEEPQIPVQDLEALKKLENHYFEENQKRLLLKQKELEEAARQREEIARREKLLLQSAKEEEERKNFEIQAKAKREAELRKEEERRLELQKQHEEKIKQEELERERVAELLRAEEEKKRMEEERLRQMEEAVRARQELEERKRKEEEEILKQMELERKAQIEEFEREKQRLVEEKQRVEEEKRKVEEERKALELQKIDAANKLKEIEDSENERMIALQNAIANNTDNMTNVQIEGQKILLESQIRNIPPIVLIYFRQAQQSVENSEEKASKLRSVFTELGVNNLAIQVNDISGDYELASFLKSCYKNENIVYPFVSIHGKPVGNFDKVMELHSQGKLKEYIDKPEAIVDFTREDKSYVGQNVFDHCLDAAEYVISGVSTILWLPITILTWPFASGKPLLSKDPHDIDIPVVHTNWYWRGLKRIFRFSSDKIIRIHPSHMDVRASHPYSSVISIQILDRNNLVIQYGSSGADYLTVEEKDIQLIKEIIQRKNPNVSVLEINKL